MLIMAVEEKLDSDCQRVMMNVNLHNKSTKQTASSN